MGEDLHSAFLFFSFSCFLNFISHQFLYEDPLQEADSFPLVFFQPYQELKGELFLCGKNFCGNSPKLLPPFPKPRSCLNLLKCGLGHERNSYRSWEVVAVQSLSCVRLFATPWTAAHQSSLYFTISRSLLKLMSIESVMASNYLILSYPLLSWQEQAANICCNFCLSSWLAYVGWSSILTLVHTVYPLKSWAPKQPVPKVCFPRGGFSSWTFSYNSSLVDFCPLLTAAPKGLILRTVSVVSSS